MPRFLLPPFDALPIAAGSASAELVNGLGLLVGWAVRETTGAAGASLVLRDGVTAAGNLLVPINLDAGESTRDWLPHLGIAVERGVFAAITGSVEGSVFVVTTRPRGQRDDWVTRLLLDTE